MMEKNEIIQFIQQMKPKDHVIMFYSNADDMHLALFSYLKAGLRKGEAAAFVATESPDEIRSAMRRFSIDVDPLERSDALHIISCSDCYFRGGSFSVPETMRFWKMLCEEATAKGFKGLRAAGDMACFFEKRMIKELLEYENSLHRTLGLPATAICAYDSNVVTNESEGQLYLDLIKAHSTVIILGPEAGLIKSY